MPTMIVVLGLCGAGKSTRARQLATEGFLSFDEKATGRSVHPDLVAWPTSAYPELLRAAAAGRDCVVTEIAFFSADARSRLTADLTSLQPHIVIQWECFDPKDIDIANQNCRCDPERAPQAIVENLAQNGRIVQSLQSGAIQLPAGVKLLRTVPAQASR